MLVVGEIDIAICHVPENQLPQAINCEWLSDNPISAFAAAAHFSTDQTTVPMQTVLEEFSWITPRDDEIKVPAGLRSSRDARYQGLAVSVYADDLKLIRDLALTTRSVGFLPMRTVEAELAAGKLVELIVSGASVSRPLYALTRKNDQLTGLLGCFLDEARNYFERETMRAVEHRCIEISR